MKIVIDLYKPDYDAWIKEEDTIPYKLIDALKNGIVLPENHGRIIDESKITSVYYHEETYKSTVRNYHTVIDGTDAPTIIEGSDSE